MALGGIKTKSTVVRKLKDQEGNLTGEEELQVSESELLQTFRQCPFGYTIMMKNGERLNADKMKMPIYLKILNTESILIRGLKTS